MRQHPFRTPTPIGENDPRDATRRASTPSRLSVMRVLVVYAHPDEASLCGAICRTAVTALDRAGHQVDLIDLYAEGFEARMSRDERLAYETDCPISDPMVERHAVLLGTAEALVFIYPTWYWGLPAVMKGWMERVLVPGVGFILDPRTNKVRGGLPNVRRIVGISTYGSRRIDTLVTTDGGRRVIARCVRLLASRLRCRTTWLGLYGLNQPDPERITKFLADVDRTLVKL